MENVDQELRDMSQAMQGMQSDFVDQVKNSRTRILMEGCALFEFGTFVFSLATCDTTECVWSDKAMPRVTWVLLLTGVLQMRKVNENLELIFAKVGAQP